MSPSLGTFDKDKPPGRRGYRREGLSFLSYIFWNLELVITGVLQAHQSQLPLV